jgi:hypothetical protein
MIVLSDNKPIFMKGLGHRLPKGKVVSASGSADELIEKLNEEYSKLSNLCLTKNDESV